MTNTAHGTSFALGPYRNTIYKWLYLHNDRLCGLVVRVSGYRSRARSPALPDFLSNSGSGTGSTQPREPREVNRGAT